MPADPVRVRDVFLAAVEFAPEQRPGYLAEACGGDADLRAEVDRLLAANADPDSILEPPSPAPTDATGAFVPGHPETVELPAGASATAAFDPEAPGPKETATEGPPTDEATGTIARPDPEAGTTSASSPPAPPAARARAGEGIGAVIAGRYRLVEVIGEGGMGSVYRAEQTEPVRRPVALKLIKTGMDSKAVLARFDAERQALALMDHPNIARIYDGGVTPAGRPFFVMELVRGAPLTEYCDQKRLPVQARLELFVSVCQAVQHAHQKGIIHRDLKPGNVLITEVDGRPTPKVIDFGVAKAIEQKLTDMSFADTGAIVGTPTYMSPEQADPSSMDIDTRTDVYALGVMLYEQLTGAPPIDARQFKRGAILEMMRMVREVDPPRPSTKLSTAEALPNIAANRSIEPARLARLLKGELDWVVMKALEKDRSRRYESANGLARDIQRYLADEVVEARPPSAGYRFKKFVRRNPLQLALAGTVVLLLLGGGAFAWWQDRQATERRAEARNREQQANQGVDAAMKLVPDLRKQYKFEAAKKTLEQAAVLARGAAPDRLAEVEQAIRDLAFVERLDDIRYRKWIWITAADGKGHFNQAIASPAYRRAFAECDLNLTTLDPAAAARRIAASAVKAELVAAVDDWALHEPEPGLRDRLLDVARRADPGPWTDRLRDPAVRRDREATKKLAADADSTGTSVATLGVLAELMKRHGLDPAPRLTAARAKYPADFELAFILAQEHFRSMDTQGIGPFEAARALRPENYAVWVNLGDLQGRKGQLDEAIACLEKAIELDPRLALAHIALGAVLCEVKRDDDGAIACFRTAIELDPTIAEAHANLGEALKNKGRWDEAIARYKKARELNPNLLGVHNKLAYSLIKERRWDEAIVYLREAIELDPKDGKAFSNLGGILCDVKRDYDGAIACFRRAIELDPKDATARVNLGNALSGKGRVDEGIECYQEAIAIDPRLALAHSNLGSALEGKGRWDEAVACYRRAIELDPKDALFRYNLGSALGYKGKMDEAIECYEKAIALDPQYAEAHCNMASALASQGRFAEALVAIKRGHELGSKRPDWRYPSAEWVRHVEATAAMEAKLPAFLKGEFQPGDTGERLGLAEVCHGKKLYRKGTALFAAAFTADPKVADDLGAGYRYNALCNAALAAAGRGEDTAQLDDKERARLRKQALDWLRADLALGARQLETANPADRAAVREAVRHWQQEAELASLRDAESLARLPAEEREAFTQLWAGVAALSNKVAENAEPVSSEKVAENAEADRLAAKSSQAEEHLRAGKLGLALPLLVEILDVRKARLGPDHPDTLATLNQLGVVYWRLRRFDKSVPLFEELLKRREGKHGRDQPGTQSAVANLGVNYRDAGRLEEAVSLLEEADRAARKYPELRWVTGELLDAYGKAGQTAKLTNLLRERLAEARKALPKDSPQLAQQLATAGLLLLRARAFAEAEPLLRECLPIRLMTQPDDWSTFNAKSLLGGALVGQKRYAEAEPLLLGGYEGMKQREETIPPQGKDRIPEAIERLVQLYEATGRKEEAAKWRTERDAIRAARKKTELQP